MLRAALPPRLAAWLQRRWRPLILAAAALVGVLIGTSGLGVTAERLLQESRFALRQHAASGDLAIVEIEAHSGAQIDRWPWPRRNHAALIDRLHRAGAASITFAVAFSSRSSPADAAALAAALRRAAGPVVLFAVAMICADRLDWQCELVPALAAWAMMAGSLIALRLIEAIGRARAHDAQSGLPNRLALLAATRDGTDPLTIATARIADYDQI